MESPGEYIGYWEDSLCCSADDSASVDSSIKYESSYAYDYSEGYEEGRYVAYSLSAGLGKTKNKSEKLEPQSTGRPNRSFQLKDNYHKSTKQAPKIIQATRINQIFSNGRDTYNDIYPIQPRNEQSPVYHSHEKVEQPSYTQHDYWTQVHQLADPSIHSRRRSTLHEEVSITHSV
jgi:hypothetical protein